MKLLCLGISSSHGQYILKVTKYLKRGINEGEMPLYIYFKTPLCMHLHYSTQLSEYLEE